MACKLKTLVVLLFLYVLLCVYLSPVLAAPQRGGGEGEDQEGGEGEEGGEGDQEGAASYGYGYYSYPYLGGYYGGYYPHYHSSYSIGYPFYGGYGGYGGYYGGYHAYPGHYF